MPTEISRRGGRRVAINTSIKVQKIHSLKNYTIVPSIHFGIEHTISNNSGSAVLNISDSNLLVIAKPIYQSKTLYTIGGTINVSKNRKIDLGIGYDYNFKPKFKNHSCYINIALKF
jgi:hypothetical protein